LDKKFKKWAIRIEPLQTDIKEHAQVSTERGTIYLISLMKFYIYVNKKG